MLTLFDHQKKGVDLLTTHEQFGLFWDMGSGKTLTMLMHLSNLVLAGEAEKILWLAPKSALGAVGRDISTMRKNGMAYRAEALEKSVTCMNYEKLSRKDSKYRKQVDETKWDVIVCDEAHSLCHPTSNRTKYVLGSGKSKGLIENIKYRYAMTGTPVTNSRLEDFWSFMRLMCGGNYMTYSKFEEAYLKTVYLPGTYIKITKGYKNTKHLLDSVAGYSQSIRKEDCLDLPEQMPDNIVEIPWKSGQNDGLGATNVIYYNALKNDVLEANDEVFDNALVRILRLRQIAAGGITVDGKIKHLSSHKADYALELIENNPHKTVVFYEFKSSFEAIVEKLEAAGIPYMYLNGEQKDKNIWLKFQEADETKCRVFLAQYRSGNAGIDLYTSSDTIFYEPCVSSTVLNQARSRTHRNGVSRACTYTFLIQQGSIEQDIYEKLKNHEDFNEKLWLELKRKEYQESR